LFQKRKRVSKSETILKRKIESGRQPLRAPISIYNHVPILLTDIKYGDDKKWI